ncbi:conserved hypothetical protein [delta proteobacterium NaphS2]|nr:conserved hypothetical protein [delta proteobacterium NaphS2]
MKGRFETNFVFLLSISEAKAQIKGTAMKGQRRKRDFIEW